jgi:DNA-binding Lrp family transcriptional regulator
VLKGQDLLVAFHLAGTAEETLSQVGRALGLSAAEVHNSIQRLKDAQLLRAEVRKVHRPHLIEFAVHGARFAFAPVLGRRAGGIPTAQSAPPLNEHLASAEDNLVWKYPRGSMRAQTLEPIYRSAPGAALRDANLYRKLALLDAIRVGGARVRGIATDLLVKELKDGD